MIFISKEDAVSKIFNKVWTKTDEDGYIWVLRRDVVHTLDDIPTSDMVEVVRCEECTFWDAPPSCEGLARCQTGESGIRFRKAYDFCSRGHKKINGDVKDEADSSVSYTT